tara:strand:- start:376 stop:594 length:219 start_codon:yes stop_codon:yes gene_type:complete
MPKVKLTHEFTLPDEQSDLDVLMLADKMYFALTALDDRMRSFYKHEDNLSEGMLCNLEIWREIIQDSGVRDL